MSIENPWQDVKLSEIERFNFAYNPGRILNILMSSELINSSFLLISFYFADVFALLEKRVLGTFEVALAQKVKMASHMD